VRQPVVVTFSYLIAFFVVFNAPFRNNTPVIPVKYSKNVKQLKAFFDSILLTSCRFFNMHVWEDFSLLKFMFPTMYALWRIAALNKEKQYNRYSKFSKKLSLFWNYPNSFYNKTVHKTKIMVGVNNRALNKVFLWRTKIYFPEETQRKWKNFFLSSTFLVLVILWSTQLGSSSYLPFFRQNLGTHCIYE
jgi:hypothetical protein